MSLTSSIGNFLHGAEQGAQKLFQPVQQAVGNAVGGAVQQAPSFGQKLVSALSTGAPGLGVAEGFFSPHPQSLAGQYTRNQVINPISQGVSTLATNPNWATKLMSVPQIAGGAFSATPPGMEFNLLTGGAAGALRAARTGQNPLQSIQQGVTQPTSLAQQGLGIKNHPIIALGLDTLATRNPKNLLNDLGDLKSAAIDFKNTKLSVHPDDLNVMQEFTQNVAAAPKGTQFTDPKTISDMRQMAVHYFGNRYKNADVPTLAKRFGQAIDANTRDAGFNLKKIDLGANTRGLVANEKPRGLTTSVKGSAEVSPETQAKVNASYTPKSNQTLLNSSDSLLSKGLDKATNTVHEALAQEKGKLTDQNVSDAIAVAKAHDAKGNFDSASQIYDKLAEHLTEAGRQVQAASLLSNRTPQGLLYSAQKTLSKAGVELTPEIKAGLQDSLEKIKQTQPGTDARQLETQKMVQFVNDKIPRSKTAAAVGIWRAGLLTGPETVAKVAVSHAVTTPFEMAAQIPAALADRAMSLVTGKRSLTATTKGFGEGLVQGSKALVVKLKTGIDLPNTGGFESDFGRNTHQTAYENTVGNIHGSLPKPAFTARYKVSLNDQALTEATNQGLKGADKQAFVKNFVDNPSQQVREIANKDAAAATNQQKTGAGDLASQLQKFSPAGIPIGKILAPFTRIPSAIGANGLVNYTPLGLGKEVLEQIQSGHFDQRTMAQAFGRSATGTTVAALGAALAEHGLMTLKAPSDAKERALWDAQGKQPNSIKLGDKWISLNAFGPVGIVLGVGGAFGQSLKQSPGDVSGATAAALAGGGRLLLDQPYLKGISGVANALNDPTRYGQTLFNNTAGSVVPALSSQIARGTDTTQRMYPKKVVDQLKAEVPGLAEQNAPQRDLYGRTLPGANPKGTVVGGAIGTINPFYPSTGHNDPVTTELQRLYDNLGSSDSPAIGQPQPNQTVGGQKVKLNNQQLSDYIGQRGSQVQQQLSSLISSPDYQALDDNTKSNAVDSVLKKINTQTKLSGLQGLTTNQQSSGASANQPASTGRVYTLVNPDTGAVKKIDLSKDVASPTMTGDTNLDTQLLSKYGTALTTRANDIVTLFQNKKINEQQASQQLAKVAAAKKVVSDATKTVKGTGKAKAIKGVSFKSTAVKPTSKSLTLKLPTVSGGSSKVPKLPALKGNLKPLKFGKSPKLKA